MARAGIEVAYQEAGPLVHTLALRALGSVEEAEDVVRRVFAAAAASDGSLVARDLLHDAAERIAGDLERRMRARLDALDAEAGAGPATDPAAVVAEADRILLRAAVDRLEPADRELLERALVHGDPRYELALMTGTTEEDIEARLQASLLALWHGPRLEGDHEPTEVLAARALGCRTAPVNRAHIGECRECRDAWRGLNDLVGSIARMPTTGPVLAPREGLWEELQRAIEAGEGVEPEPSWREVAEDSARRAHRRRTVVLVTAVVLASLFVGLTVIIAEWIVEPDREVIAQAALTDPRDGGDAGRVMAERTADGTAVLVVEGPYGEYPDAYLALWLMEADGTLYSLGQMASANHEVALPDAVELDDALVVISLQEWGDFELSDDLVAYATLP